MANAAFCEPYDATVITASSTGAASGTSLDYMLNNEPGLVYRANVANPVYLHFDLGLSRPVRAFLILGVPPTGHLINVYASNSAATLFDGGSYRGLAGTATVARSASTAKYLLFFSSDQNFRYWGFAVNGGSGNFQTWRVLICGATVPVENISIGAEESIDDRSVRRYTRAGRLVVDPVNILPSFSAEWPWLTEQEARQQIWPVIRKCGATKPVVLLVDTAAGPVSEDYWFFGNLEKTTKLVYDEGVWRLSVSIVAIDP
jgi:hypothetical protein